MDALKGMLRRLRALVLPRTTRRELDAELDHHLELETAAHIARGVPAAEARRLALRGFGGVDRYREETRDVRGAIGLEQLGRDVRLALRMMRKAPQFTGAVVLTLALGIGANTAIFSVVDAVLLGASPFADADALVMVWETDRDSETYHEPASWPDVADLRERSRTLEDVGVLMGMTATVLDGAGEPERVAGLGVTPVLPRLLGVTPLVGRLFGDAAAAARNPDGGPTGYALLGEEYWRARFGADPAVVGRTLTVDERPVTVVGVLPADADLGLRQVHARADYSAPYGGDVALWLTIDPTSVPRESHPFLAIARLAPGATLAAAQAELAAIMTELEQAYPENAARGVNLERYGDVTFGGVRPALLVLLGAVALVLLVACVNVANLLLARTQVRAREIAVRRALGAARGDISRQFLVESLVLTAGGAAAGIGVAYAGLALIVALAPPDIPRLAHASVDLRALGITAVLTGVVSLAFGLLPLMESRRLDLHAVLKSQPGRRVSAGRDARRFRGALVVVEVAIAVMLVIGAGLLLRSFQALLGVEPGFRTEQILKVQYELPQARYPLDFSRWPNLPEINHLHERLRTQVSALPGVTAAALAARHPLDPGITNSFVVVGREAEAAHWPEIRVRMISTGYLETLAVPLVAGRALGSHDAAGATPAAVVNRSAAERYFAGSDPIGQQIRFWGVPWQIVGVIGDERFNGLAEDSEPAVYVPLAQAPQQAVVLLVRAAGDPAPLVAAIRGVLRQLDPQLALFGVESLEQTLAASVARPRFTAVLLALFAALAATLAAIGIHGVLSYTVAQRSSEIGIRMALGATRAHVLRLVVGEGAALAAIGTAIGLAGAFAGSRVLASLVFGISHRDAPTYAAVAIGVLLLAAVASWLPARRAARLDPGGVLHAD